jgi:hypothetical protein
MMNNQARKPEPTKDKKKTGKQRPNMMSNQGPGEDASTGKFAKMGGMGAAAGLIARSKNKKKAAQAMGGMLKNG